MEVDLYDYLCYYYLVKGSDSRVLVRQPKLILRPWAYPYNELGKPVAMSLTRLSSFFKKNWFMSNHVVAGSQTEPFP